MSDTGHKYPYEWRMGDTVYPKDKGKVFSCFACGGGSTMGYNLAGYDVIGCNEIDPRMNLAYVTNHHPKHNYLCDIREIVVKAQNGELPEELYQLDVLDGSPPCSSFSLAGRRDKDWGKEKVFREGQVSQVLDTLFFDFIDLAGAMKPKVCICENVKGIICGKAKAYTERIVEEFGAIGYKVYYQLLDSSRMGVPQKRNRVFFIAVREDQFDKLPGELLDQEGHFVMPMSFNEPAIPFGEVKTGPGSGQALNGEVRLNLWRNRLPGDKTLAQAYKRLTGKSAFFSNMLLNDDDVVPTLTTSNGNMILFDEPRLLSREEVCRISTFPMDYDFGVESPSYVCGMCVPPVMMAHVAGEVYERVLKYLG